MNITCPRCGKENPEDVRFCLGCGTDLHGRGSVASSIGRPPPLGVPPRLQPPPPLGAPRPAGGPAGPAPLGPPPGPPSFASGPAPLNAPPSLSSNPLSASTPASNPANPNGPLLGPMPSLSGPPGLGGPSGLGAPPGLGSPPGMGGFAPSPMGPPPSLAGAAPMGGMPPLLGAMPPLPGAAPPPVAPVAPAAMPPPMGGLPPLMGAMPSLSGAAPPSMPGAFPPPVGAAMPPPMSPNPFGAPMAPVPPVVANLPPPVGMGPPPVPPMGPPPVPPMGPPPVPSGFGSADPFASSDPFGGGGDAFANVPPADPFAAHRAAPPVAPRMPPPDPFAAMNNPFASPSGVPLPGIAPMAPPPMSRPMTVGAGGNPYPVNNDPVPTLARARQATVGPGAVAWPPNPGAPSFHQQPDQYDPMTEVRSSVGASRPRLMVTQLDGAEQGEMPLNEGDNLIGREVGGIFAEDNLLSSRHATLIVKGGAAWVRDEGSRNGVYIRLAPNQRVEMQEGDQFCLGRIILRFDHRAPQGLMAPAPPDAVGFLSLVVGRDVDKGLFPLAVPATGLTLGRSRSDVRFPNDGWISGLHCQLIATGPQVFLVDLKSSNGTYARIRGTRALNHGDALLMGQRIFHVNLA